MRLSGSRLVAAIALLGLAACTDAARGASKTDQSSAEHIAAALDVCAQGSSAFTQKLCDNHPLAALDNQTRQALVAQSANISDAGAALLVQNQARWREAQRISCGVSDPRVELNADQQRCLESEFRARAQQVRTAVQQMGGYTFQRMELVDAAALTPQQAASTGLGDAAPAATMRDIEFPRIDGRQTPAIQRFNDLVAQEPQSRLGSGINETVKYAIAYAGPDLISVRFSLSQDSINQASSSSTLRGVNVLMGDGHELTEDDVFQANSGWENFITDRAVHAIAHEFPDYANFPPRRDVYETATKPHLWLITDRGLVLMFPTLSYGGSQSDEPIDVTIPWADLRPYLNPSAPAPIHAAS